MKDARQADGQTYWDKRNTNRQTDRERNRQMSAMTVQRKYLYSVFAHMHTQSVGVTVTRSVACGDRQLITSAKQHNFKQHVTNSHSLFWIKSYFTIFNTHILYQYPCVFMLKVLCLYSPKFLFHLLVFLEGPCLSFQSFCLRLPSFLSYLPVHPTLTLAVPSSHFLP